MKYYGIKLCGLLLEIFVCFIIFPSVIFAANSTFTTKNYDVTIGVNLDKSYSVTENLTIYFPPGSRLHGFFREIPLITGASSESATLANISVSGDQFTQTDRNGSKIITIGNPDQYVSGEKSYTLSYVYTPGSDIVHSFDSFYFNVIPFDWDAIDTANMVINMPKEFDSTKIQLFSGPVGTTKNIYNLKAQVTDNQIKIRGNKLKAKNGITILLPLTAGYFSRKDSMTSGDTLLIMAIIVIVFVIACTVLIRRKKDEDIPIITTPANPVKDVLTSQKLCSNCKSLISPDSQFCPECGKPVSVSTSTPVAEQPVPIQNQIAPAVPRQSAVGGIFKWIIWIMVASFVYSMYQVVKINFIDSPDKSATRSAQLADTASYNKNGVSLNYPQDWKSFPEDIVNEQKKQLNTELPKYHRSLIFVDMYSSPDEAAAFFVFKIQSATTVSISEILAERRKVDDDASRAGDVTKINELKIGTVTGLPAVIEDVVRSNGGRGRTINILKDKSIISLSFIVNDKNNYDKYIGEFEKILGTLKII